MAFSHMVADVGQKQEFQGERGKGGPALAVPHGTSGGVGPGWVGVWFRPKLSIFPPFVHSGQPDLIVSNTGGTFYDPEKADYSGFEAWLQCYSVAGMKSVRDHNGRTMWFKVSLNKRVRVVCTILNHVLSFHRK